jgi:hypothetical protein
MSQQNTDVSGLDSRTSNTASLLLVLLGLTAFTISEPLLSIFGANPEIFYFHNIDSRLLKCVYALCIALLPAVLLWVAVITIGTIHKRIATASHYVVVCLLAGLWFIQLAKWNLGITQPVLLATIAGLGGIAFLFAYAMVPLVAKLLRVASVAPFLLVGIFLFTSETGSGTEQTQAQIGERKIDVDVPSVVFILLDELPTMALFNAEKGIDRLRFPNLAEFADQATWYRHYTVLAGQTNQSVPSILTGNKPMPNAAKYANFPNNLFSLLAPTHHLTVLETVTALCGLAACGEGPPGQPVENPAPELGAILQKSAAIWWRRISLTSSDGARLDDFQEKVAGTQSGKEAPGAALIRLFDPASQVDIAREKSAHLEKFLTTLTPGAESTLYFIHLVLPHVPWRFYADGQLYEMPYSNEPFSELNNDGGEWIAKLSEFRFFMQAQYTDRLVGEIFSRLKALGMWDDALVIVTADHGRSFLLNTESRLLGPETFGTVAYAPLFIKRPQQTVGEVDDSNLMAFDLLPTIADIVGVPVPFEVGGLPAGHSGIAGRGDEKICYPRADSTQFGSRAMKAVQTYSDAQHFPELSLRHIGPLEDVEGPLTPLNGELGLEKYIGGTTAEFAARKGGRASVLDLALLQRPATDKPPLGVVMGHLEFEPAGDRVLVAVNGRFVTGSPLLQFKKVPHTFVAMLPAGSLAAENEIQLFLVEDQDLVALEVN